MVAQETFSIQTRGRETVNITHQITSLVDQSGIHSGICQLFLRHTSASLILCENADPDVRSDLERYLSRLVKDGDSIFQHTMEGPDDMSAHIRTILTHSDLSLPISNGRLALGTWQGIYLWEHRTHPHNRQVMVTLIGE
ncbi:MAG: secondary thiamine-phosphate synthase enzyme YjbQ [Candidatus Thiodiazotropha lotti]|uniref:Secondary thiamine-phosphate synthase n=1 Tax=Candidatus Thiodiazotropha endoloripes TaxID=1818881 RepID=A0A1E2UP54_9GAMM|nr:secondary thiamine-phosphate synthase enzyme YjbQ [Candidatus Thiodiazotropha endoloripes]MCG7899085.1 secondary thiamine-phosphate synthase enzyme YjbQ [Candidatus Thiodiazotropha weberae]MCG7993490.1 secondary thiamine-phosphate synthase enzyme YjbQ [Candidatus Thiodiazotropha lotti]MCG7901168.1 secondary thiamine-phosphate synthase enzyme YjbQ [Candidatus Thiodiazotropha weberae]MCG7913232.1 secondary thiamine-phosphate synthase enzyme YjbQ [Candidatus Thiodiazotropha weberae]MCG7997991.